MKLGIINGWEEGCFRYVKGKGLEAVEFCVNHNNNAEEFLSRANEIKGYSDKYEIAVGSMGRWGMKRIDENGEIIPEALQSDKSLIDAASIIGCPVYNCGVNYVDGMDYHANCENAINYLRILIGYAEEKNVKIAVYNCRWENFIVEPKVWEIVLSALPELGIKYDISHCIYHGGNYLEEMRDWGDRFYHFHIKGSVQIGDGVYDDAPAGLDTTNWGAAMDILYTKNYNGMLSIEPHSRYWQGKKGQWGIDFTIKYIKQFIMPEDYEFEADPYMP